MEPLSSKDPKSIGDYTLIGRLGSGGMGIVYLAANGPDSVALKVIRESLLEDPSQATRFSREIETLKRIKSRYVAKIINSGVTDGKAWYATEFVNGPDLKSLVDAKGPLRGDAWIDLAKGLLQGISAIHAQGIIHRDIKPANVIVSESGPKIIDFGIAQVSDATSVTSTGLVAGTPAWFSPEQIEGKTLTVATDLFSAGSVLTYAAIGKSPWGDENTMTKASVYGILVSEPNLSGTSPEQLRVISPLLEKEPSKRCYPAEILAQQNGMTNEGAQVGRSGHSKSPKSPKTFAESKPLETPTRKPKNFSGKRTAFALGGIGLVGTLAGAILFTPSLVEETSPESTGSSSPDEALPFEGTPLELTIGGLVPQTGVLAFLGPSVEAAMLLAQQDINQSELGVTIDVVFADEGDFSAQIELDSAQFLAESGASVVVGPLSSSRALNVIDYLTLEQGIVMISPANSSRIFETYDSDNLYFRTVASDSQQGTALADLMIEDGAAEIALVGIDDPYAFELAADVVRRWEETANTTRLPPQYFEIPVGGSLTEGQLSSLSSADAILVATFDEAPAVVTQIKESGARDARLYLVDGNLADYSADPLPRGYLNGAKGTLPAVDPVFIDPDFYERLNSSWVAEGNAELDYFPYAVEAYDAVVSAALASLVGGSVASQNIARFLEIVAGNTVLDQWSCRSFDECASHHQNGDTFKYVGLTGPIGFTPGLSVDARVSVYEYSSDNSYFPVALRTARADGDNRVVAMTPTE